MALFARANANAALLTNNCFLSKLTSHDVILRSIANYANKCTTAKRLLKCTCPVRSFPRSDVTSNSQNNLIRKCHVVPHNRNYVPYEEVLAGRRQEAKRSILVQVQSSNSYADLFTYCEKFGPVNGMHYYMVKESMVFYLVEFNDPSSAEAALESATHVNYDEIVPVQSPMLWFRNTQSKNGQLRNNNSKNPITPPFIINDSKIPKDDEIIERIITTETISEQMILFHDACKLDEVGVRLRFLTAHQLERNFAGLFPHIAVLPFGSSVNGFGKHGCDLDLVLSLENNAMEKLSSRFVFHTKSISSDRKVQSKKLMETIADLMQYFIPGVSNVRRILQARVPIIKYDQTLTGLECDLSMTNMAASYMSELLCLYGEVDWRVRPLVFTIRQWAKNIGLTNVIPGRWITNFSITLLVLFYLQQRQILPTLNTLKSLAREADIRLTDPSADCTFLRDVTKLPSQKNNENTESLETLLQGFFEYYSSFDFPAKGISLREGTSIFKPDFSPLYIANPLETMLNVSKNVSVEEMERLKLAVRNAMWILETAGDDKIRKHSLLSLLDPNCNVVTYVAGKRTVNVAALFKIPNSQKPDKKSRLPKKDEIMEDRNKKMKKGRARRR